MAQAKAFFFAKKSKKLFPAVAGSRDKSFLVLFYKKGLLALHHQPGPIPRCCDYRTTWSVSLMAAPPTGPDFRLGEAQLAWAERELEDAEAAGQNAVVFVHTYPADLREEAERLSALLARLYVTPAVAGVSRVAVRARDGNGRMDEDQIEPIGAGWAPPRRRADGSDADRIGAWPERGVFDTQLGPNRNGRNW